MAGPLAEALGTHFPADRRDLVRQVGHGLRSLVGDDDALDQARHSIETGTSSWSRNRCRQTPRGRRTIEGFVFSDWLAEDLGERLLQPRR